MSRAVPARPQPVPQGLHRDPRRRGGHLRPPGQEPRRPPPVEDDQRYTAGSRLLRHPQPVAAPTTRSDFSTLGWTTTDPAQTWTMQEPFGAYTWYAVNDHPSDKALYDFTISAPSPVGGCRQRRAPRRPEDAAAHHHSRGTSTTGRVVPRHGRDRRLPDDADTSASGVPITYWTAATSPPALAACESRPPAWTGSRRTRAVPLLLARRSCWSTPRSGMETQTMITLGRTEYTTSERVLVHELVHQWYGDLVTPDRLDGAVDERGHGDVPAGRLAESEPDFAGQTLEDADERLGELRAGPAARVGAAGRLRPRLVRRGQRLLRARADVARAAQAGRRRDLLVDRARLAARCTPTATPRPRAVLSTGSTSAPAPTSPLSSTPGCTGKTQPGDSAR